MARNKQSCHVNKKKGKNMLKDNRTNVILSHQFDMTQQTCSECGATFVVFVAERKNATNKMKKTLVTFCPVCGKSEEKEE